MRLIQQGTLGTGAFDDIGRPTGVYLDYKKSLIVIAGSFAGTQWHGRDVGKGRQLRHRVGVYESPALRRIAILDLVSYPINDITFHPHRPLLAIAAGNYDGGYTYEGGLILWDFATAHQVSLLDTSREVITCRFDSETDALHITLRPPIDEDFYDAELRLNLRPGAPEGSQPAPRRYMRLDTTIPAAAWHAMERRSVDLDQLPTKFTQVAEFRAGYARQPADEVHAVLVRLAAEAGQRYTPRWDIWDLAWSSEGGILATRNQTALECWAPDGALDWHLADTLNGVQLLLAPDSEYAYVNLHGDPQPRVMFANTNIARIDLRSRTATPLLAIDAPVVLSIANSGALLARDAVRMVYRQGGPTFDRIITSDLVATSPLDLGRYDPNNHYLRIDGANHFYFLQGASPRASIQKWVCRIDPHTLHSERLFPLEWDTERGGHLLGGSGLYIRDLRGESLVIATTLHRAERPHTIVRRARPDGKPFWLVPCDSQVTALAYLPHADIIIYALTGGQIGAINAQTGAILDHQPLTVGGSNGVALSLAAQGNRIAAGLVDGRIALYAWA